MNVDESLTTDNYDMAADNLVAAADASLGAASTVDAASANASGSIFNLLESVDPPTTLASMPLQPVQYGDVEEAANQLTNILLKGGIARARAFSSSCHQKVSASPSWSGADRCAAFDFAGSYLDTIIAKQAGWPESGYFRFQRENQSDFYAAAGAPSYLTSVRLSTIRRAAESAAADSLRAELAEREARNAKTAAQAVSDASPAIGNNVVDERGD